MQLAGSAIAVPLQLHVLESGKPYTLKSTFYHPKGNGPFPLVVLNHGAPTDYAKVADQFTTFARQSDWFVAQGYAVLVPNRRGYGGSTGPFAEGTSACDHPDFTRAAAASARDVVAAMDAMRDEPRVDTNRVIFAGVSAGGFASLAAGAMEPAGLAGIINIDGGRGSLGSGRNCDPAQLVTVSGTFGATTTVPSLWMYAANDHRFDTTLARQMFDAYERDKKSGRDTFAILSPSGTEGHYLFETASAMESWTPVASEFLKRVVPL
jgi:dienelactone hydrolase